LGVGPTNTARGIEDEERGHVTWKCVSDVERDTLLASPPEDPHGPTRQFGQESQPGPDVLDKWQAAELVQSSWVEKNVPHLARDRQRPLPSSLSLTPKDKGPCCLLSRKKA
jgi:hypothetical protein